MYMSVKQAAEKWGISDRRVRILCSEEKISGVIRDGRSWKIPEAVKKPEDGRYKSSESLLESVIKQIHYLVLADKKEDRGIYRKVPVRIMGAKHDPAQPYLIQPKMEQLLENYSNSTETLAERGVTAANCFVYKIE